MCHANFLQLLLLVLSAVWLIAVVLDPQSVRAAGTSLPPSRTAASSVEDAGPAVQPIGSSGSHLPAIVPPTLSGTASDASSRRAGYMPAMQRNFEGERPC